MDFHVGSATAQSADYVCGSAYESSYETPFSGFLNRKCVSEAGGKKSKDRTWQTYWCQLKGVSFEFHRVDGVKNEGFKPPPRDILPPPHLSLHKAGFVSVAGAIAEDDYTSQIGKDLQKRRSWLFELTLSNNLVYLLQAPNGTQRAQWIQHIRRAASGEGDDAEGRKLKAARCSVRHRSRQNVLSLKGGQTLHGDGEEAGLVTTAKGNCARIVLEMLKAKKELLSQMSRMCNSFLGDTQQLYGEEFRSPASVAEPVSLPRRLSLPSPVFSSVPLPHDPRRASCGTFPPTTTLNHSLSIRTRLLKDHLLVPGANWSQLRQGDEIVLTGRLDNGWFRCLAKRDVATTIEEGLNFLPVYSHFSDDNGERESSNCPSDSSDILPDASSPFSSSADTSPPGPGTTGTVFGFVSDTAATDNVEGNFYPMSVTAKSQTQDGGHYPTAGQYGHEENQPMMRVERSYSYVIATQSNPESSLLGLHPTRRSLDYCIIPKRVAEEMSLQPEERQSAVKILEELFLQLAQSQSHNYRFPLAGIIPPSVVENVPDMLDLVLVTPPHFSQSSPASIDSSHHSTHQQLNGHLATATNSLQPLTSPLSSTQSRASNSAPATPIHTPVKTPPSPAVTPSHVDMPPYKLPLSPSKSPRSHRRAYEPVTTMLDHTFIRRFLPRKKPSKHISLPDQISMCRTPTIEEEVVFSGSLTPLTAHNPPHSPLPPPAMLEFSGREMQADMRARVSSVSGRPIRSTGICLQFGEDESSSDSDIENSTELDVHESLHSLTEGSPHGSSSLTHSVTYNLLLPPRVLPEIMAPGNLRRAVSVHGSLHVKVEDGEQEFELCSRSASMNSLTSALVSGLQKSFKRHIHAEEPLLKIRGPVSQSEGQEPESTLLTGIFRQPPTGKKRFVYLDPCQPKYGFRLENYAFPSKLGQEIQAFVQSVSPGSPAFMSGLFPGDTILEVNGISVRSDPVAAVVKRIQDFPRKSEKKVQLAVMFVNGVTRLELMKKTDHLRYKMKMKQAQLRVMISEESGHFAAITLPPARGITLASDLTAWSHLSPLTGTASQLYPYDGVLNEQVAFCSVHPSKLASDVLVIPLSVNVQKDNTNFLTQLVMEGGPDLLDELCLAAYCRAGDYITTRGYLLPAHSVYHCVFGNLEENLRHCIWQALDNGSTGERATIAFWLDGFSAVNVSPHSVIEFVRLWLQQGGKSYKYKRIVFVAAVNPDLAKTLIERYFPLAHYYFNSGTSCNIREDEAFGSGMEDNEIEDSAVSQEDIQQTLSQTAHSDDIHFDTKPVSSVSQRTLNAQRLESEV